MTQNLQSPGDPSLALPLYGATFPQAIKRFYAKYATFTGRASRSEYWWVALFLWLLYVVLLIPGFILGYATGTGDGQPGPGFTPFAIVFLLVVLASIVPGIAVAVRRLHDAGFSGWLYLITLVPNVGSLIVMVFHLLPSNPEGARFDAQ